MTNNKKSPFDDASGKQFLRWFSEQGGIPSAVQEVTPAGTVLADATPLQMGFSVIRDTAAAAGVLAPSAPIGVVFGVVNLDASNDAKLWPSSADITLTGDPDDAGDAVTLFAAGGIVMFIRLSVTEWYQIG